MMYRIKRFSSIEQKEFNTKLAKVINRNKAIRKAIDSGVSAKAVENVRKNMIKDVISKKSLHPINSGSTVSSKLNNTNKVRNETEEAMVKIGRSLLKN